MTTKIDYLFLDKLFKNFLYKNIFNYKLKSKIYPTSNDIF